MKEALYYEKCESQKVECTLCPHKCVIQPGKIGICRVRQNIEGTLYSLNYGIVSALSLDPIEKKPLYRFYPGSKILSVGSIGCNLKCDFCQNWEIATLSEPALKRSEKNISPDRLVELAVRYIPQGNIGMAYTYNEPTVWFEYMRDIALAVKRLDLRNVMVSNGYIESGPLSELLELIDAFNIDLKGYSDDFYRHLTKSKIDPVLNTLEQIARHGNHLEIAYLVIPGKNDNPDKFRTMMYYLKDHLGDNVILHVNRYFPCYKMSLPPTSIGSLNELADIAREILSFVHVGNI